MDPYDPDNKNPAAFYGLPNEVKFCKRCVVSNQRPNSTIEFKHNIKSKKETIRFDAEGICDACRYAELKDKEIDWDKREQELKAVCDKFRRDDGYYDCIVPGSGGKDSCKASWLLKYKYGMHPLTVTWAPHMYTPYGWKNFQNWIHEGGFSNILFHPNGKTHRLLTSLAFKNLLHPFQPFILGQKNIGVRFSLLYDIPLVFYGENEAEYGNPIKDNKTAVRDSEYHEGSNFSEYYLGGVPIPELIKRYGQTMNDLSPFLPVDSSRLKEKKIEVHYMGYYIKWDPQEAYYFACEHCGFEANTERTEGTYSKYNSIDDKSDPFHYWTTLIKFGIGRTTYDASQEIRNHKITREEGIALVKKFDQEFPKKFFKELLDYMEMSEGEFGNSVDKFRSPHLWMKKDGQWILRHTIWENGDKDRK
jgi:N-acetyl sugar amidotransferase